MDLLREEDAEKHDSPLHLQASWPSWTWAAWSSWDCFDTPSCSPPETAISLSLVPLLSETPSDEQRHHAVRLRIRTIQPSGNDNNSTSSGTASPDSPNNHNSTATSSASSSAPLRSSAPARGRKRALSDELELELFRRVLCAAAERRTIITCRLIASQATAIARERGIDLNNDRRCHLGPRWLASFRKRFDIRRRSYALLSPDTCEPQLQHHPSRKSRKLPSCDDTNVTEAASTPRRSSDRIAKRLAASSTASS